MKEKKRREANLKRSVEGSLPSNPMPLTRASAMPYFINFSTIYIYAHQINQQKKRKEIKTGIKRKKKKNRMNIVGYSDGTVVVVEAPDLLDAMVIPLYSCFTSAQYFCFFIKCIKREKERKEREDGGTEKEEKKKKKETIKGDTSIILRKNEARKN